MKKIIMLIGQISIIPMFPVYGLWMCIHQKTFDIVVEWFFNGCRYEDSELHKKLITK